MLRMDLQTSSLCLEFDLDITENVVAASLAESSEREIRIAQADITYDNRDTLKEVRKSENVFFGGFI